jgi:hypothetical protein
MNLHGHQHWCCPKAGVITSPLQWTPVYIGTPYPMVSPFPSGAYCACLPQHVVEWLDTFCGMGKHKVGLT